MRSTHDETEMNEVVRAGLACPHNFEKNQFGKCRLCRKESTVTAETHPKTGQKLVKQTKRKPKEEPKTSETMPAIAEEEALPRKGKTLPIPGTERSKHKDITRAAERLEEIVDEEKAVKKRKDAATATLIEKMKAHGETSYIDGDLEVFVTQPTEKVTVRRKQLTSGDYE